MAEFDNQPVVRPAPRRLWLKLLGLLIFGGLLFGAGWFVGHGNKSTTTSSSIDYTTVNRVYDILKQNFDGQLDSNKLLDGIKHGLVGATGDPYTTYFNDTEAKDFQDQLSGSFSGIGAELGSENSHIVIISPLAGYPAAKAGLKPKDVVAAIDGKPTTGMSVDAVVSKIRGPVGAVVKLTIIRNQGTPFNVSITRAKIKIATVKSSISGQIGYMQISQFSEDTVGLAQKAAANFKAKGVKAVILDLRGNPGGFLDGAVDISSLWLDEGQTVVSERRGSQVQSTEKAHGNNVLKGLPTIVLIDGGSASASEITAGALHDNKAAQLVGQKSFGKGSVQKVECLDLNNLSSGSTDCNGPELKVTIAHWYTPDGINIDKQGIIPDITVKPAASGDAPKAKATQLLQQKIH